MAAVMLASKTTGQQDSFRGAQSPVADAWDEALHQLAGRMMSMGFSQAQVYVLRHLCNLHVRARMCVCLCVCVCVCVCVYTVTSTVCKDETGSSHAGRTISVIVSQAKVHVVTHHCIETCRSLY
jgi:hypothetical protein